VIPPGIAHGYVGCSGLKLVNLVFDSHGLGMPSTGLKDFPGYRALFSLEPAFRSHHNFEGRLHLPPSNLREVTLWIQELEGELHNRGEGHVFVCLTLLMRIIGHLSRLYSLMRLSRVLQHIENHYAKDMKLGDLAKIAHMSERTLQRYFRQTFAQSPVHYVNRLRIGKACEQLAQSDRPIFEIANRVGIVDSNYFTRLFHQVVGVSPSVYRKSPSHYRAP